MDGKLFNKALGATFLIASGILFTISNDINVYCLAFTVLGIYYLTKHRFIKK